MDGVAAEFRQRNPRSSYPQLKSNPVEGPDTFRAWARESHEVALDWAADMVIAAADDIEARREFIGR